MAFKKGQSGNPQGRPPGAKNRTNEEIRSLFAEFLSLNIESLQSKYDELEPKDQLQFIERIAKIVLPRPLHPLETLTDEQLNEIIEKLKKGEL